MTAILWILAIVAWAFAIHGATRSSAVWAQADRSRGYWISLLVILNAIMLLPYLFGVLPKLLRAEEEMADNRFEKRSQ